MLAAACSSASGKSPNASAKASAGEADEVRVREMDGGAPSFFSRSWRKEDGDFDSPILFIKNFTDSSRCHVVIGSGSATSDQSRLREVISTCPWPACGR